MIGNVLVLYDNKSTHVQTIYDSIQSFSNYSKFNIFYANATSDEPQATSEFINKKFEAVIIHFSVRLSLSDYLKESWAKMVEEFNGPVLVFLQDEFDVAEIARRWIERLKPQIVYSIIPESSMDVVYPKTRFPRVQFKTVLAGYIPDEFLQYRSKKIVDRPIEIGYRGRDLPYWYGKFAQEKKIIGVKGKEICQSLGISHDIEWHSSKRIYGRDWHNFLCNVQVMMGTEGGANILDEYGAIKSSIESILEFKPDISFDEVYPLYLEAHEGRIITNQLTPKIFEAISLKTGLLLFEGEYSGILEPNKHYIPLRKDFSNFNECYEKIKDKELLKNMIDQTYVDIVLSKKYLVSSFVKTVDEDIEKLVDRNLIQNIASKFKLIPSCFQKEIEVFYK